MLSVVGRGRPLSARLNASRSQIRGLAYYKYVGDGTHCPEGHESTWEKIARKLKPPTPGTLILVRHGETEWNQKRLFTGWVDVDLSDRGIREIEHAARLLLERGISVDVTYTSLLRRAVRSSWIMLNEIDQVHTPVLKSWRLNERMYGALEGHSKPGLASLYGDEVVHSWREGLIERPPAMTPDHPYWHGKERKYINLPRSSLPTTESLEDTIQRTAPLWHSHILPDLRDGRNVLIVAHRNSLRGILKIIDGISTEDIQQVSVPNGIPLVYKFDEKMRPIPQKDAVKPLNGVWLGKLGLLRAALAQEAELSKHLESYPYSSNGNKFDTKAFYYHSSAYNTSLRSKYSAQELELSDADNTATETDHSSGAAITATVAATADAEAAIAAAAAETVADALSEPVIQGKSASMVPPPRSSLASLDKVIAGSDAHLVRKLILLDEERKLFDLVEGKRLRNEASIDPSQVEVAVRCEFEYSTSPDIFIDPIVLRLQPQEYGKHLRTVPPRPKQSPHAADGSPLKKPPPSCKSAIPTAQQEVEVWRLNQTWYYKDLLPPPEPQQVVPEATRVNSKASVGNSPAPGGSTNATTVPASSQTAATAAATAAVGVPVTSPAVMPDSTIFTATKGSRPACDILQRPVLVIIRHGKTEHNKLGLFTGWEDAALSPEGRKEARYAGKLLRKYGVKFDVIYTSWLSRAIETGWLVMNELDALWLPIVKTWRLNERMYGALTGLSKKMIRQLYGEAQFKRWRRGYDERPPPISSFSAAYPGNDSRYVKYVQDMPYSWFESFIRSLAHGQLELHRQLPKAESLKDCMDRTIPFFMNEIKPDSIDKGKSVLIASSENAIRGLLMHLCNIPVDRIHSVEIPTGLPLVYDSSLGKIRLLQEVTFSAPGKGQHKNGLHHHDHNGHNGHGPVLSGRALLDKYNFGSDPSLLFDFDNIDVPLEVPEIKRADSQT